MSPISKKTAIAALIPLALMAGCGGNSGTNVAPDLNAANEFQSEAANNITVEPNTAIVTTISGRVADGYIQGATVCVDINDNGVCDDDEPSAITGVGGVYELDIPEGETEKSIVADVPATAIDEDTGQPIGKKLTLSTPADRPDFISPITTLVHDELRDNPTLSIDQAEDSVKEELGLSTDEGTGLFVDYVASQHIDDDSAEDYRHLHQAARVIATMMDEIQDRVEEAAHDNGLDFTADDEASKAMKQLVRKEVRDLLPDISLAVAEEIQLRNTRESSPDTTNEVILIDAERIADNLSRTDSELDIVKKIDAIREKTDPTAVAIKDLLTDGMYWLQVECEYKDVVEGKDLETDSINPVKIVLDDEGVPTPVRLPSDCAAEYGHVMIEDESNQLVEQSFEYDTNIGVWVKIEDTIGEQVSNFHLVDGEWITIDGEGPSGPVEFLDDGGAILESEAGNLLVYATSSSLDNTRVINHIYRIGGNKDLMILAGDDLLFPQDSSVHQLSVKRKALTHVLFNWEPQDDVSNCNQFNGNCNVVDVKNDAGFTPATSLDAIREQSLYGVKLSGLVHNHNEGYAVDLELTSDSNALAADGLPESGTAIWFRAPTENEHPLPYECYSENVAIDQDGDSRVECTAKDALIDQECQLDYDKFLYDDALDADGVNIDCSGKVELSDKDKLDGYTQDDDVGNGTSTSDQYTENEKRIIATAPWELITVDGVAMIKIELPLWVKHGTDSADSAAMLLIEESGFVRRGAKLNQSENENAVMYSAAAFETLKTIAQDYISQ